MFDFLKAAFPWVVIGIAIALFAVNHVKEKRAPANGTTRAAATSAEHA